MRCFRIAALLVLVWSLGIAPAFGAYYIKFDGVEGESAAAGRKGWSELESFSHGMRRSAPPAGGGRVGALQIKDLVGTKTLDKASPKLAEALLKGVIIPKVWIDLTVVAADGRRETYLAYELTNVLITSYELAGSSDSGSYPAEEFSLNFEEIKVTYTEFDNLGRPKSTVDYLWKVAEGEN